MTINLFAYGVQDVPVQAPIQFFRIVYRQYIQGALEPLGPPNPPTLQELILGIKTCSGQGEHEIIRMRLQRFLHRVLSKKRTHVKI